MRKQFSFEKGKWMFWGLLLLNLIVLWIPHFYPSMDGAAHLYNANLLKQLMHNNVVLSEYYSLNGFYLPNWTDHILLLFYRGVFPAWIAEKCLLMTYVIGMALSFRFLIKQTNSKNLELSILIFPFIYTFLFHLGFYNLSISIVFLFLTLAFWFKYDLNKKMLFVGMPFLLILAYYSNILSFAFIGITIGFYELLKGIKSYTQQKNIKQELINLGILLLVSIPGLWLSIVFFNAMGFSSGNDSYPVGTIIKWIFDARSYIIYDYPGDEIYTEQFFHVLMILTIIPFLVKRNKDNKERDLKKMVLVIPLLLSIMLLFVMPNNAGAGMMSDRYLLYMYMFGLLFVVSNSIKHSINKYIIIFIVIIHIGLQWKHMSWTIVKLDKHAKEISACSQFIESNAVVLPVNFSNHWIEPHFGNYLGVDKPLVLLENYELGVAWFPLKWSTNNFPRIRLGEFDNLNKVH